MLNSVLKNIQHSQKDHEKVMPSDWNEIRKGHNHTFCIKSLINVDERWFIQSMWVIIEPVVTLDDVRDVVIRSNNNKIKRNQREITSKVYVVYVTKWLSMVNTRDLKLLYFTSILIQNLATEKEFLRAPWFQGYI